MARPQRTNPPSYRAAQVAARERETALSREALRILADALQVYAAELFRELSHLADYPDQLGRFRQIRRAQVFIQRLAEKMESRFYLAVNTARDASFRDILDIWRSAGREAALRVRLPKTLLEDIPITRLPLAGAFEALGTPPVHWKTLLQGYTQDAVAETQAIVREALLSGMSSQELARRLRPYVQGAQAFHQAFGRTDINNTMLRTPGFDQSARKLLFNADRIAYSEIHNARTEAERQAYMADPLVGAVGWRLSPNRGTTRVPDVCDFLARTDFYGLGPGVYPIRYVPIPPHPHDRCELVPIVRQAARAADPKPLGNLDLDQDLDFPDGTTSARQALVRRQVSQALTEVRSHPIQNRIDANK